MQYFISSDWGTTNHRLRVVDAEKKTSIAEWQSDLGIAAVNSAMAQAGKERFVFFREQLSAAVDLLQKQTDYFLAGKPVIISGMASSSVGMMECKYLSLPVEQSIEGLGVWKIDADEIFSSPVYLVTGWCTEDDILRGEESLLAGCNFESYKTELAILPGTHSKHLHIWNGKVQTFNTYLTGELFQLLSEKSLLQYSVSASPMEYADPGIDFQQGIKEGAGGNLLHKLFGVRARHVLGKSSPQQNMEYLSGLLIGSELTAVPRNAFDRVSVIASGKLMERYAFALEVLLDAPVRRLDAALALINTHCGLYQKYAAAL